MLLSLQKLKETALSRF